MTSDRSPSRLRTGELGRRLAQGESAAETAWPALSEGTGPAAEPVPAGWLLKVRGNSISLVA